MLQSRCLRFDERVLDRPDHLRWEHGSLVHGPRDWFLPGLEHAFHGSAHVSIHESISFHVRAVQTTAEIDSIWCSNVLHYRVQDVKRR